MTDSISANDFDPPLTGKQVEQVQEVINEALRRRAAEPQPLATTAEQVSPEFLAELTESIRAQLVKPVEPVTKSLASYTSGEFVDVIKNGEWMKGVVNGVEKKLGMVYVHTDRGPVTVASTGNIRPRQS